MTNRELIEILRPYLTHNLGCEWLAWMGVNRSAAQQRDDCKCGFFEVVTPLVKQVMRA